MIAGEQRGRFGQSALRLPACCVIPTGSRGAQMELGWQENEPEDTSRVLGNAADCGRGEKNQGYKLLVREKQTGRFRQKDKRLWGIKKEVKWQLPAYIDRFIFFLSDAQSRELSQTQNIYFLKWKHFLLVPIQLFNPQALNSCKGSI